MVSLQICLYITEHRIFSLSFMKNKQQQEAFFCRIWICYLIYGDIKYFYSSFSLILKKNLYLFPDRYVRIINFSIGNLLRKIEAVGTKTLEKILKRNLAINTFMKVMHFLSSLQMFFRDWYVYICLHQKKKIEWASSLVLSIYMLSYNRHFLVIQMLLLIPHPHPPEGIKMSC